jgi:hypothetical protein
MTDWLGFILQILGLTFAAGGYVWLLIQAFRESETWGTVIFCVPPLAVAYLLLRLRRAWGPALLLLLGAAVLAAPYGIRHYQRAYIDLGERVKDVDGELHVTLTGWDKQDYAVLEHLPDAVVVQMANPDVTDEALKHLAGMKDLRELDLNDSQVTDAGLKWLGQLPRLQQVRLRGTKITDAGFREHLMPLKSLRNVEVNGTTVRGSTLREWKNAQPGREYLN